MDAFPNDNEFQDHTITEVTPGDNGYHLGLKGFGLWCPYFEGPAPSVGDTLRVYSKGFGHAFRGLFINGRKVFYRTEAEDEDYRENEMYGADAADWLKRWDEGRSVWSVEMGGIGPGYEQCIQIVAAEVVRFLLKANPHSQDLIDNYKDRWSDEIDKALFADKRIDALGLSGAQAGAGKQLGARLYMDGPRKIMNTPEIKDRKIQVSRTFPVLA